MCMMLLLLLILLLLPASAKQCELLKPRHVNFYSLDMNTTLTWMPPENAEDVFYTVTYSEYGSKIWHRKLQCTNITWTWCDLSHEANKCETIYYANVTVSNGNCSFSEISEGFQPRYQTILGPPKINLFSTASTIVINLSHPIVDSFCSQLKYHIYLDGTHVKETEVPYYEKEHLDSHTRYCITAKLSVFGRESNLSNSRCVTTKRDYLSEEVLQYILPVVLATLTFVSLAYAVHKYIYVSNVRQPHILNRISRSTTKTFFFEAHSVPISVIITDREMVNLQDPVVSAKQTNKQQLPHMKYKPLRLPEEDIGVEPDITDEGSCYGYGKFQDNVQIARPNISPYDMPHWPLTV